MPSKSIPNGSSPEFARRVHTEGLKNAERSARACFDDGGAFVATAAVPAAADIAMEILREGGNAFDAVLAACFVEAVCLPMKCGLGGDVVALVHLTDGRMRALISVGPGGARFGPGQLTLTGPRSVGVPGAPDGYAALA